MNTSIRYGDLRNAKLFTWGGMTANTAGSAAVYGAYRNNTNSQHVLLWGRVWAVVAVAPTALGFTFYELAKATAIGAISGGTNQVATPRSVASTGPIATGMAAADVQLSSGGALTVTHTPQGAVGTCSLAASSIGNLATGTIAQDRSDDTTAFEDGYGMPVSPGEGLILRLSGALASGQAIFGWKLNIAEL